MLKQQFIEKSKKKLLEKWKRIEKTMTNHMSGRKIWDADTNGLDDEANYLFVDETLENFLDSALSECWDMAGEEIRENFLNSDITFKKLVTDSREAVVLARKAQEDIVDQCKEIINSLTSKQEGKV